MRPIARTITRRLGEFVVSLSPTGIQIHRYRHHHLTTGSKFTWDEVIDILGAKKLPKRSEAFESVVPKGWQPQVGDEVYLNPNKTRRSRGIIISAIPAVPQPCYLVRMAGGKTQLFERCDLRPAPKHKCREKQNGRMLPLE